MFSELVFDGKFFEDLERLDAEMAARVRAEGCQKCRGPLYTSNYPRKPRGALIGAAGETHVRRFSLCCGKEGCRGRATPPSLRFLGRRVYLEAVVIVVSVLGLLADQARGPVGGVPKRTVRRWHTWWSTCFLKTAVFATLKARFVGLPGERMPAGLLERMAGTEPAKVADLAGWLAPLTTGSVADGARFVRELSVT